MSQHLPVNALPKTTSASLSPNELIFPSPWPPIITSPSTWCSPSDPLRPNQDVDAELSTEATGDFPLPTDVGFDLDHSAISGIFDNLAYLPATLPVVNTSQRPVGQFGNPERPQTSTTRPIKKKTGDAPKQKKTKRETKTELEAGKKGRRQAIRKDRKQSQTPQELRAMERSRIAASKCRRRKLELASALAAREQALEDRNHNLASYIGHLKTEIEFMKAQLFKHTDCNCILIKEYIANEAKKYVDKLISPRPTSYVSLDLISPCIDSGISPPSL